MSRRLFTWIVPAAFLSPLVLGGCFDPPDPSAADTGTGTADTTSAPGTTTNASTTDTPPDTTGTTTEPPADSTTGGDSSSTGPAAECGNGMVEADEECDDGNTDDEDGCAAACTVDEGWDCDGASPTACMTVCGDSAVGAPVEQCDDGNMIPDDDCTDTCQNPVCGDGIVWMGNELCDDGGMANGDGCSAMCQTEAGFVCQGAPSMCAPGIFLADGSASISGNLWAMSLDGMNTIDLGPLGVPLTAMAFHPNGTLYGVTSGSGGGGGGVGGVLGTIDLMPAAFNPIGALTPLGGGTHGQVPDITFMGTQLLGWTETGDDLILIDTATAMITIVTAPENSYGTGLAFNSANGLVLLAPDGSNGPLWTVDGMGAMMSGPTLGGTNLAVKGMSFFNGLLYGMDANFQGGPAGNVVTYDPATGAAIVLGVLPTANIDALAVYDPNNTP